MTERPALDRCTVGIYGLGLMGGSFASALRLHAPHCRILAVDRSSSAIQWGLEKGIIDSGSADPAVLREAHLVVPAVPVDEIKRWLVEEAPGLNDGTVIVDLGSTKEEIVRIMESLPDGIHATGGHPMAGREASGVESSDPSLFTGAPFFLVPTSRLHGNVFEEVSSLVSSIGAVPIVVDGQTHDRIVAATSHVPYLASVCLTLAAGDLSVDEDLLASFIAGGFRDTSRLAACQPSMAVPMCATNRANVVRHLRLFVRKAGEILKMLEEGDDAALMNECLRAKSRRGTMIP
jgi:prephenate dehydrogenase